MGISEHGGDPIRGDIAELRHEMQNLAARLEGAIEKSAKEQLRFLFLASGAQLAAIAGLLALLR